MRACLRATNAVILLGSVLATSGLGQVGTDGIAPSYIRLSIDLCKRMTLWLEQGDANDAAECDRLIDRLLVLEKNTIPAYLAAAQAANLRGRPNQAISILESLVSKYPEHDAEVMHVPVKVLAPLWMGTYAKQAGDMAKANNAYEQVLKSLKELSDPDKTMQNALTALCALYLAEIDATHFKNTARAQARLDSVARDQGETAPNRMAFTFLRNWVTYRRQMLSGGEAQAVIQWPDAKTMGSACVEAAALVRFAGITDVPLSDSGGHEVIILFHTMAQRAIAGRASPVDVSLVRLVSAYDYHHKGVVDKASECYSALLEEDSFLSPVAGAALYGMQKDQGKENQARELLQTLRAKYPGCSPAWDEVEQLQGDKSNRQSQPVK
jgi:tetratricopeptide (TPR) repeat protein